MKKPDKWTYLVLELTPSIVTCCKQVVSGHVTVMTRFLVVCRETGLAVLTRDGSIVRCLLVCIQRFHRHVASQNIADKFRFFENVLVKFVNDVRSRIRVWCRLELLECAHSMNAKSGSLVPINNSPVASALLSGRHGRKETFEICYEIKTERKFVMM